MNDKERQAIERCKQLIKVEYCNWIGLSNQDAIETVLNLIENQQAEIIKTNKQKHNQSSLRRLNERKMRKYKSENKKLKVELEKKDKIIDEMAKYISETDIDEDVCMKNVTNTELCNEEYSNCVDCIKKYFERKVENG